MVALARYWKDWIHRYTSDTAYWYVPKGKSIADVQTIRRQLELLSQFEGQSWRESQPAYLAKLQDSGLSEAIATDEDGKGIPMARMLTIVFSTLGFAWIDVNEAVTLTLAGEAFIKASDPAEIVSKQARRYQIANPMAGGSNSWQIEVHPVAYLLEVLLKTKTLTTPEYVLFCARAKSFGDIDDSVEGIAQWRGLGPLHQENILRTLEAVRIALDSTATRRKSIYNTVKLNAPYALAFWAASGVIVQAREGREARFRIPRGRLPEANGIVRHSQQEGQFIAFTTKKDWIAFYGDLNKPANRNTALDYYKETAQLDKVHQVLDEMKDLTEPQKRQYFSAIVDEETIENILARNIELVEPGMTLLDRQLQTEVGRIDLFARDRNGTFTIIELKKGKTDDDVFGQLSRYLGWCKKTKARTENVRGIIIAKQIGRRLWAAADGHATPVELMEYELKMSLEKAQRGRRGGAT